MMDNTEIQPDIYSICKTMLEDVSLEYKILFVKKITDLYFISFHMCYARACVCACVA